jgi:hypothetical protein
MDNGERTGSNRSIPKDAYWGGVAWGLPSELAEWGQLSILANLDNLVSRLLERDAWRGERDCSALTRFNVQCSKVQGNHAAKEPLRFQLVPAVQNVPIVPTVQAPRDAPATIEIHAGAATILHAVF